MPSKIYSPLRANQTRFLTIKPSLFSFRNIHCTLETVDVEGDKISKKEALPYTCGDKVASHRIVVNSRTFKVRANLYQALRHLRDKLYDRTIWIDAICINQEDLIERGAQVLLMSKIFSSVRQVIVWLGVENEGGDPGLRLSKSMKDLTDEQIREYSGDF
ncbi:heterokaryon incompatibility protein-domain-containing protein [Leptodontidium sp. MPI-SDFR-AT-0119]|nr:heterokaryon incompatibility protein-domain-containing protein [Leptodontidium sp. MPI-SDFR-AT-0119]